MQFLRAAVVTGFLALAPLACVAGSATAAPDSEACYRYRVLLSAEENDGVYVDPNVLKHARYHCENNIEQSDYTPLAPVGQPYRPREPQDQVCNGVEKRDPATANDYLDRTDQVVCIADWVEFARYTAIRPGPCIEVSNAERQGQTSTEAQRQACNEAESRDPDEGRNNAVGQPTAQPGQPGEPDDSWKPWWQRQSLLKKALLYTCIALVVLVLGLGVLTFVFKVVLGVKDDDDDQPPYQPPPGGPSRWGGYIGPS